MNLAWLISVLTLLLIPRGSQSQSGGGIERTSSNGKTPSSGQYTEEYETYETLQRSKAQKQRTGEGLKTRYMEFAETEFNRASLYTPLPFMSQSRNRLLSIPARTLNQLIRQHIAHNRIKQLALQNAANTPVLQGVSRVTELRQTPFRRWSGNSSRLTYQEKRRQWKAELKRRLQGQKVPAGSSMIPPLLISGGGLSSIQADREPEHRYYVTYSPQTRIYQVSRRPPPYLLYTTDSDVLPEQLETQGQEPQQVTAEPNADIEKERPAELTTETPAERVTSKTARPATLSAMPTLPTISISTTLPSTPTTTTMLPTTTATKIIFPTTPTTMITTSTGSSVLFIVQNAREVQSAREQIEHRQQIQAVKKQMTNTPIKQILFLDDYEQVQEEESNQRVGEMPIPTLTTELSPSTKMALRPEQIQMRSSSMPAQRVDSEAARRRLELEKSREQLKQQFFPSDGEEFAEEEDDDEDVFFFKPGIEKDGRVKDPFRILVHKQGMNLI